MKTSFIEKREKFFTEFYKQYPNWIIIEFTNLSSYMLFKDQEGNVYKRIARRVILRKTDCASLVDKHNYFKDKLEKIHPNLKLIRYAGQKEKILVEDENGFQFTPVAYDLLKGHPVSVLTCTDKYSFLCLKFNIKHNNKYSYPSFSHKNGKQKIKIICPNHGEFYSSIESHLIGSGCPKCKSEKSTFNKSLWVDNHKERLCTFYILEFYNEKESFIKIGVTSLSIKKRYNSVQNYKYNVILEYRDNSKVISDLEVAYLKKFKKFKYTPIEKFEGKTECFSTTIKEKINEQFKFNSPR